ncbi:TetR/AcrR family transcriptional regulator [Rhodococcus sp. NPDC047139]|uniref:TetR/AcrR family transcriptional regulator n=1 Tax=Rhodococcus sp. NPDC047139 TaxID=3155141 RepID=UPI003403D5AA
MSTNERLRRRIPQQDRSRAMVERIIAAGHTVLLENGYEGASTNRIARTAGISPGSVYQYFPDKDAIVAEVVDRWTDALHARISCVFAEALDGPADQLSVRVVMGELLDALGENPRLLRVLIEELPRSPDSRLAAFERRMDDLLTVWLRFHLRGHDAPPVGAIAWMLVRTVENVAISYVLDRPPVERDIVADELTAMVTAYLRDISLP